MMILHKKFIFLFLFSFLPAYTVFAQCDPKKILQLMGETNTLDLDANNNPLCLNFSNENLDLYIPENSYALGSSALDLKNANDQKVADLLRGIGDDVVINVTGITDGTRNLMRKEYDEKIKDLLLLKDKSNCLNKKNLAVILQNINILNPPLDSKAKDIITKTITDLTDKNTCLNFSSTLDNNFPFISKMRNYFLSVDRARQMCDRITKDFTNINCQKSSLTSPTLDLGKPNFDGCCDLRRGASVKIQSSLFEYNELEKPHELGIFHPPFDMPNVDFQKKLQLSAIMDGFNKTGFLKSENSDYDYKIKKSFFVDKINSLEVPLEDPQKKLLQDDQSRFKALLANNPCVENPFFIDSARRLYWKTLELLDAGVLINVNQIKEAIIKNDFSKLYDLLKSEKANDQTTFYQAGEKEIASYPSCNDMRDQRIKIINNKGDEITYQITDLKNDKHEQAIFNYNRKTNFITPPDYIPDNNELKTPNIFCFQKKSKTILKFPESFFPNAPRIKENGKDALPSDFLNCFNASAGIKSEIENLATGKDIMVPFCKIQKNNKLTIEFQKQDQNFSGFICHNHNCKSGAQYHASHYANNDQDLFTYQPRTQNKDEATNSWNQVAKSPFYFGQLKHPQVTIINNCGSTCDKSCECLTENGGNFFLQNPFPTDQLNSYLFDKDHQFKVDGETLNKYSKKDRKFACVFTPPIPHTCSLDPSGTVYGSDGHDKRSNMPKNICKLEEKLVIYKNSLSPSIKLKKIDLKKDIEPYLSYCSKIIQDFPMDPPEKCKDNPGPICLLKIKNPVQENQSSATGQ